MGLCIAERVTSWANLTLADTLLDELSSDACDFKRIEQELESMGYSVAERKGTQDNGPVLSKAAIAPPKTQRYSSDYSRFDRMDEEAYEKGIRVARENKKESKTTVEDLYSSGKLELALEFAKKEQKSDWVETIQRELGEKRDGNSSKLDQLIAGLETLEAFDGARAKSLVSGLLAELNTRSSSAAQLGCDVIRKLCAVYTATTAPGEDSRDSCIVLCSLFDHPLTRDRLFGVFPQRLSLRCRVD